MASDSADLDRRRLLQLMTAGACASYVEAPKAATATARAGRRIGVALGSGGLHGYAHIGVIRAFEKLGFVPEIIAGTSVGAIIGLLWASGASSDAIEILSKDPVWSDAQSGSWRFGPAVLDRLQELIGNNVKALDVRDLPKHFVAVATDVDNGEMVLLNQGKPGTVAAASACVPLRHAPIRIGDRRLVDGALTAPIPVDAARTLGADFVVAVDVAYRPYEEKLDDDGMTAMAFQMMHIMINRLIVEQIRRADFRIRLDLHAAMTGKQGARALIEVGENAARAAWPKLQQQLAGMAPRTKEPGATQVR